MTKGAKAKEPDEQAEQPKTCFVIMPISDVEGYPLGHFAEVYQQLIKPAVEASGYVCSLATSTSSAHMIQLEVVTKVATADLCICDLSTNNPNVLFEYGIRQAFDLPTVLIKDDKTRRIFDLSGFRDIEYDHNLRIANILSSRHAITTAITDTVDGANDENQIFSLVKLMKLTKAALPTGEVSRDDARFSLIEKKLDGMMSLMSRAPNTQTHLQSRSSSYATDPMARKVRYGKRYDAFFDKNGVRVTDNSDLTTAVFGDSPVLEASTFWEYLSENDRIDVLERLSKHSSDFIPF